MIWLSRRQLLGATAACCLLGGCERRPTRDIVLEALVRDVMLPAFQGADRASASLSLAANRLLRAPSRAELDALQAAWRRAALSWKRVASFRFGPLGAQEALLRGLYWPARAAAIEAALANSTHAAVLASATQVAALGADAKGLFAIEYLLFDRSDGSAWPRLRGDSGEQARRWIAAYADDLATQTRAFPAANYTQPFVNAGQVSLNQLVSRAIEVLEVNVVERLSLLAWLSSRQQLEPVRVEGGLSGSSPSLLLAQLRAIEDVYIGHGGLGLATLVVSAAPQIDARIRAAFSNAIACVRALTKPQVELRTFSERELESAKLAVHSLEVSLKTELVNTLGVTLTFNSLDAD